MRFLAKIKYKTVCFVLAYLLMLFICIYTSIYIYIHEQVFCRQNFWQIFLIYYVWQWFRGYFRFYLYILQTILFQWFLAQIRTKFTSASSQMQRPQQMSKKKWTKLNKQKNTIIHNKKESYISSNKYIHTWTERDRLCCILQTYTFTICIIACINVMYEKCWNIWNEPNCHGV